MLVNSMVDNLVDSTKMPQLPPISFRLTTQELELLNEYKQDDESINQCAARLLRERLGIPSVDSQSTTVEPLLQVMICETANELIHANNTMLYGKIQQLLDPIVERIDAIEIQLNKPTTKRTYTKKKTISEDVL